MRQPIVALAQAEDRLRSHCLDSLATGGAHAVPSVLPLTGRLLGLLIRLSCSPHARSLPRHT